MVSWVAGSHSDRSVVGSMMQPKLGTRRSCTAGRSA